MTPNDWNWELPADYPRCLWADVFYRTGRELFTHLSGQLTPELVEKIEQRLLELRNELMGRLTLFHYATASGPPHQCVDDLYIQAVNRLRLFSLTMQAEKPAHPTQRQVPLTHEDVLDIFEQLLPADMPFGEERDESDTG
jgi:hypothetical protein